MPAVVSKFCLRDGSCVYVCPVDCIVPGNPQSIWPHFYIDPLTCIDCSACIAECPNNAIYTINDIPDIYIASGGEIVSMPEGTDGYEDIYETLDHDGQPIRLNTTRVLEEGESINLIDDVEINRLFFDEGPGYE
ncbi:MAG: ferredoxin family protein [Anaerolineaceae bacterium]|nr:ferredoxin family protein [Anaerolineaceae bacterium]